jgi:NTP pyrophosphatase (non-canonical NTP hydrolase)
MSDQMEEYWMSQQAKDVAEIESYRSFDGYQDFTDTTAIYPEENALEYLTLGLVSEAGEVAGKVKKWIRDDYIDEGAIIAELGDVLWYIAQLASAFDIYLSDIAKDNVEKLTSRKARGTLTGNGDNR